MLHLIGILAAFVPCYIASLNFPSFCKHEQLTDRKGTISVPFIRPAIYCKKWMIQGKIGNVITVSFSKINLEKRPDGTCGDNYLVIGSRKEENLCGSRTPHVFISEEGNVWIKFFQNTSVASVGFKADYTIGSLYSPFSCLENEYRCGNGKCIFSSWVCNGADECGDSSDEAGCIVTTTPKIPVCKNTCISMETNGWIELDRTDLCNGFRDCLNGEDEDTECCGTYECREDQFKCSNGHCVNHAMKCDGLLDCTDGSDEVNCSYNDIGTPTPSAMDTTCDKSEMRCMSLMSSLITCLEEKYICDGVTQCLRGEDEDPAICTDVRNCENRHIMIKDYGYISSPFFPKDYPNSIECAWYLQSRKNLKIQLRFQTFILQRDTNTDHLAIYDGPDTNSRLINIYYGMNKPPSVIESTSNFLTVIFHSDSFLRKMGFKFSYQNKGSCLPNQRSCITETDCYEYNKTCDGDWDCPLTGHDEKNCHSCQNGLFSCGPQNSQCYEASQRCNGANHCTNMRDELHCSSVQCGPHNGTFLCNNKRCIYETWKCDKTDDCGDSSDEENCHTYVTNLIKIAAVSGALICGLLLVVALGCTCKLYNLRVNGHRQRHETPLSRLYSEFIRRRAPPPYHEAMITSRPYDDVRRDYLERLQQNGGRPPSRRGRRNRNRHQAQNTPENSEAQSQECLQNNVENTEVPPVETQNYVNTELERQNSTSLLIPPQSSSDESESDDENESVQVTISEENIVTASYRRESQNNKSDSDNDVTTLPTNSTQIDLDQQSADVCSVDATIASCDSIEPTPEITNKTIGIVVETVPRRRQDSIGSVNSAESEDNSFGEFTLAEV